MAISSTELKLRRSDSTKNMSSFISSSYKTTHTHASLVCTAMAIVPHTTVAYDTIQSVRKLEKLTRQYPVLKSRYFHLKGYVYYLRGRDRAARRTITAAVCSANEGGLKYEAAWAAVSEREWFSSVTTASTNTEEIEGIPFYIFTL